MAFLWLFSSVASVLASLSFWYWTRPLTSLRHRPLRLAKRDAEVDNGGRIVAEVIKKQGIETVFTLIGGHISPILVGCNQLGIRVVDVRDECTAVFAADAASRLTGVPHVAVVTAGPGLTNTITPIKNAQMANSPVIVLAGATATLLKGRGSLQDIDQISLMRPHVKRMYSPKCVADLLTVLEDAFYVAQSGTPGPVCIELPLDLLYPKSTVRETFQKEANKDASATATAVDKKPARNPPLMKRLENWYIQYHFNKVFHGIENIPDPIKISSPMPSTSRNSVSICASWLLHAKRPLLVVGTAAVQTPSLISDLIRALERIGAPVFLTSMARGLLGRNHPLQKRHKRAEALKSADLVILAGVPMDFRLGYGRGVPGKIVSVATDPQAVAKNRTPQLAVVTNPSAFLIEVANCLESRRHSQNGDAQQQQQQQWNAWFTTLQQNEDNREQQIIEQSKEKMNEFLNPVFVCQQLEKVLDDSSILVADGGDFVGTASYIVKPRGPLCWLDPGPFGTLGVGAGFALGAKCIHPDKEIWIIYGDGALGYSIMEFDTFVRHKVPVIAIVGNDACWMQIYRDQHVILKDDTACMLSYNAKYHEVAKALGGEGFLVDDPSALEATLLKAKEIAKAGVPVLVNVLIGKGEFRKGSISI